MTGFDMVMGTLDDFYFSRQRSDRSTPDLVHGVTWRAIRGESGIDGIGLRDYRVVNGGLQQGGENEAQIQGECAADEGEVVQVVV